MKLKLTKNEGTYKRYVKNFKGKNEIDSFIQDFNFFIKYYSLGREYCAIDSDIKYQAIRIESMEVKETLTRFENELHNLVDNKYDLSEELKLSLDIFSKHAQYPPKSQFLDLITILEIVKENEMVSDKSEEAIREIKSSMKKIQKNFDKNSEEYKEFNRYFKTIEDWHYKSINSSLKAFADKHKDKFSEYENIGDLIRNAYDIRSQITHTGRVENEEEFEKYYNFLRHFVGKLLKIMIEAKKVT